MVRFFLEIPFGLMPEADADENSSVVDIGSAESVHELRRIKRVDAVIHCAGIAHRTTKIEKAEYQRVNVEGTANITRLAGELGVGQLIYLSSVMVYGRTKGALIDESSPCDPIDEYAMSKLNAERSAAQICAENGIGLTILRPAPVIGEGCKGNFIRLVSAIDRRRSLLIGSGHNRKSMIYVGVCADSALARGATYSVFIGGTASGADAAGVYDASSFTPAGAATMTVVAK